MPQLFRKGTTLIWQSQSPRTNHTADNAIATNPSTVDETLSQNHRKGACAISPIVFDDISQKEPMNDKRNSKFSSPALKEDVVLPSQDSFPVYSGNRTGQINDICDSQISPTTKPLPSEGNTDSNILQEQPLHSTEQETGRDIIIEQVLRTGSLDVNVDGGSTMMTFPMTLSGCEVEEVPRPNNTECSDSGMLFTSASIRNESFRADEAKVKKTKIRKTVVVLNVDIISEGFWKNHPNIMR